MSYIKARRCYLEKEIVMSRHMSDVRILSFREYKSICRNAVSYWHGKYYQFAVRSLEITTGCEEINFGGPDRRHRLPGMLQLSKKHTRLLIVVFSIVSCIV